MRPPKFKLLSWLPMRRVLPLLILAAGAGLFVLFSLTGEEDAPPVQQERPPTVSVQVVSIGDAAPTLRVFGQVETPRMSVLTAGVEADITAVKTLEGASVERGQVLIVMDDADVALDVLQRQADLTEAEALIESEQIRLRADRAALKAEQSLLGLTLKAVDRADRLARSQAGSEAALDQARQDEQRQRLAIAQRRQAIDEFDSRRRQLLARRDSAAAALKRVERELERARVVAPFSGRVVEVMVSVGERADRGSQLLRIYDDSRLELRAQAPSAHIPSLRQALAAAEPVTAIIKHGGEIIELLLHRLSANVVAGQGGVDAFFRASSGQLPALGNTLEARLQLPPIKNAVVLSPDSIYGGQRVFQVRDGLLQAKPVRRLGQLIDENGHQRLIVSSAGFEAGEEILNSRLPQAAHGVTVRVAR